MHAYENATLVTCAGPPASNASDAEIERELQVIRNGHLVWHRGQIVALGAGPVPQEYRSGARITACGGRLITPTLVDCHTHMLFAGDRMRDFRDKMRGVDYQEIAARGGGIQSTVRATHAASNEKLLELLFQRTQHPSVHTVEIKTGYGADVSSELRLLDLLLEFVGKSPRVSSGFPVEVVPTWLGLHGPPVGERDAYIQGHIDVLHDVRTRFLGANAIPTVDVYLDQNAYSVAECERYLRHAKSLGFQLRGHVGQFRDLGGAELLAELGARSCDHLEQVSDAGLSAMSRAGTAAVLLPGAWRTLRQQAPNAERMQSMGVRVAVATDCNPGTSPTRDLQLCAALAVRDAGLHPDAALLSITRRAAEVLNVDAGVLRVSDGPPYPWRDRFEIWDTDDVTAFGYYLGGLARWSEWVDRPPGF